MTYSWTAETETFRGLLAGIFAKIARPDFEMISPGN